MDRLSVDTKYMPRGFEDFRYMLVPTCEITSFILAIPVKTGAAQGIVDTLSCMHFGSPKPLIVDKDSAFT